MTLRAYAAGIGLDIGCSSEECVWGSIPEPVPFACSCAEDKGSKNEMDDMTRVAESLLQERDSLRSEVAVLKNDVNVLEGMLHREQQVTLELKEDVRRLKGKGKCLHCGGPSKFEYCADACEECHESGDWDGYDPRFEDYLMVCERNICGKSRVL